MNLIIKKYNVNYDSRIIMYSKYASKNRKICFENNISLYFLREIKLHLKNNITCPNSNDNKYNKLKGSCWGFTNMYHIVFQRKNKESSKVDSPLGS